LSLVVKLSRLNQHLERRMKIKLDIGLFGKIRKSTITIKVKGGGEGGQGERGGGKKG
jgi:hypothetical protein